MGIKKTAFIVAVLLTSIFAYSTVDNSVHAIGITGTITLQGYYPYGPVYDSGKGEIFVNSYGPTSVISDKTNKVIATIDINGTVSGMAYDSDKDEIFQSVIDNDGVSSAVNVISDSNNSVVATIPMGFYAGSMAYDSGKGEIFVAHQDYNGNNSVWVISDNSNTVVAKIPIEHAPSDLAYDSGKGKIFMTDNGGYGGNSVTVISDSNNTVVDNIIVGPDPQCLAYDAAKGEVFVTNSGTNTVSVISDSSDLVVATVIVGNYPQGIAYDSGKGEIYVANPTPYPYNGSVSVIADTNNTVIATITNITYPQDVTYDSGEGKIYVTNTIADIAHNIFSDTITVISDAPDLTAPSISASRAQVLQGQTSSLTSTLATGTAPYAYQWFSEAPNASSYSPISNATSSSYSFVTSTSTAMGNWSFTLQVTDSTQAAVNSTAVTVTVNAAALPPKFNETLITALIIVIVVVALGAVLLIYFRKRKH
jgi:YVTN family beta-propeller protein